MNFFENIQSSYAIISSDKLRDMISILYVKDYQVIPIKGYYHGQFEDSIIVVNTGDNDQFRKDILFLLSQFKQDCAIVKYSGESGVKKVFSDGSQKPMGIVLYNTDAENMSYLYNGLSFSFVESKRYWKPTKKEDFKTGMLVEYLNNDKWYERKVQNPNDEWESLWKLLIKYDKVRVASLI